ncbi:glycosyltransferase family 2 protein [Candidatus Contendibacter odensensis]|uniref:Glycosyltransferase 2-like domain-containing protein n=1 Tax=Candidatus Contendobacter odensis Run_B_J11 TaxID=1400861 RepID=A0A7U7J1F7_9GAMM|nr:glycosyltransferase family 2 protein [Candidatus Contendobacter odensis]CDH43072.1 hypothetical protein BN874_100025 [Candidatus Contendobacter odensis Run_B_J11]
MLVSTIIPAFNAEHYIAKALRSALDQQIEQQIIVIDDGSTDDTAAVVGRFGDAVELIRTPNRGVSAARNEGIRRAHGEFICFLDADDEWLPEKLTQQLELFAQYPELGTAITDEMHVDSHGQIVRPSFLATKKFHAELPARAALLNKPITWLIMESFFPTSSVMTRRNVIEKAGKFDETLSIIEDRDLWIRLALTAPVGLAPNILVRYLTNQAASLSCVSQKRWAQALFKVLSRHQKALLNKLHQEGSSNHILSEQFIRIGDVFWYENDFSQAQKAYFKAISLGNVKPAFKFICCMTGTASMGRHLKSMIRNAKDQI